MGRCSVGERVVIVATVRKRVEAVIEGKKKNVFVDDTVERAGECEQVATECAEIRHDDDGATAWYPWSQITKEK